MLNPSWRRRHPVRSRGRPLRRRPVFLWRGLPPPHPAHGLRPMGCSYRQHGNDSGSAEISSCSNSSRLPFERGGKECRAVTFPPGRFMLATSPELTGSPPTAKTMEYSWSPSWRPARPPCHGDSDHRHATGDRSEQAPEAVPTGRQPSDIGSRRFCLRRNRFRLSLAGMPRPDAPTRRPNPCRGARSRHRRLLRPHRSGHAAAAPPSIVMSSRRLTRSPRRRGRA